MIFIVCSACQHAATAEGISTLREKLAVDPAVSEDEFVERLAEMAERLRCTACGKREPEIVAQPERLCGRCGTAIPHQRLAAIPDATYCVDCQEAAESSPTPTTEESLGS